jgi:hypothetical protein
MAVGVAREVALAKSGRCMPGRARGGVRSCSMVPLARGWFTQGCAASRGRGFTMGSAEHALQARREEGPPEQKPAGGRRADRSRGPGGGFWLIVAAGGAESDSGLRVWGSGWAGSGCGDWVCGDFWNSAGLGDGAGWRGGSRPRCDDLVWSGPMA